MPTYNVTLRYRLEWTADKIIKARSEHAARAQVEKDFETVVDFTSFAAFVAPDSEPQLYEEELTIEDIEEI